MLAGERTETSAYKLHTNITRLCKVACRKRWTPKAVREFRDFAGANFRANMRLDNLPGAELVVFRDQRGEEFVSYRLGYPLAEPFGRNASNFYVNNHLRITIRYHDVNTKGTRMERIEEPGVLIVGFELKAMSIDHKVAGKWNPMCAYNNSCALRTCSPTRGPVPNARKLKLASNKQSMDIIWTYDVLWVHSDVKWASRWDVYLQVLLHAAMLCCSGFRFQGLGFRVYVQLHGTFCLSDVLEIRQEECANQAPFLVGVA